MVSAFATANELVLGQIKINDKSNEITAIPELLEIRGCLVTIDAMGCQRDIAKKIVDKGADYLLAVKGNQGKLHEAFENHFSVEKVNQWKCDTFRTEEKSHVRMVTRLHIVNDIFDEFVNLSFDWKMDVAMREDDCRIRRGNAAEMLTGFRHMAVNMLNNTKTFKAGLKRKQKKAAMSTRYLSEVLAGCGVS